MRLVCIRDFGNFKPGQEVEVPDGAAFDRTYFTEAEESEQEPELDTQEEGK